MLNSKRFFLLAAGILLPLLLTADEYSDALAKVETWIAETYKSAPRARKIKEKKLDEIVKSAGDEAAKIAVLKKEFLEAFVGKEKVQIFKLRESAEQGNTQAQLELGHWYRWGKGVKKNLDEAVKWYSKSADRGNASAQLSLGYCYLYGEGVEKDSKKAVEWFRKSANQGNAFAQLNLGLCYRNGKGVEKDPREAVKWIRKSAERGNAKAQYWLGHCYLYGEGVKRTPWEAFRWFDESAKQGNADAKKMVQYIIREGIL